MPENTVRINNKSSLDWYVGDSKIEDLVDWLNQHGLKNEPKEDKIILLKSWIKDLIYPYNLSDFIFDVRGENKSCEECKWIFKIYTYQYEYQIVAIDRQRNNGYLGCQVSSRKRRVGEDWVRGSDLPDGPFIEETWLEIKDAIIRYELVKVQPKIISELEEVEEVWVGLCKDEKDAYACNKDSCCSEEYCKGDPQGDK